MPESSPKLVQLTVSTISHYNMAAHTVTTKNMVLKWYRIRDMNIGRHWFTDILCRNSSHGLPKPCLNTLCRYVCMVAVTQRLLSGRKQNDLFSTCIGILQRNRYALPWAGPKCPIYRVRTTSFLAPFSTPPLFYTIFLSNPS